jgi:hypothetical protein
MVWPRSPTRSYAAITDDDAYLDPALTMSWRRTSGVTR